MSDDNHYINIDILEEREKEWLALRARVERLETALRIYAQPGNWISRRANATDIGASITHRWGSNGEPWIIARRALDAADD